MMCYQFRIRFSVVSLVPDLAAEVWQRVSRDHPLEMQNIGYLAFTWGQMSTPGRCGKGIGQCHFCEAFEGLKTTGRKEELLA